MIVCPRCGKENQDHYKFCLGCGAELPRDAAQPKSFTAPTPPSGVPAVTAADVSQPVAATPAASAPAVQPKPASVKPPPAQPAGACPQCGSNVPPNFKFCGSCGHDMTQVRSSGPASARPPSKAPAPQSSPSSNTRGSMVLIRPDGTEGDTFSLGDSTIVGRDASGPFAGDSYLSPRHAEFLFQGNTLKVRDLDSLNGVYIRVPREAPVEINPGAVFRIGQEIIELQAMVDSSPAEDGTEIMGSPNPGYIGRIRLVIGRESYGNSYMIPAEGMHLGRERGDIIFPEDGYVSGLHCRLHREGNQFFLTDVGSSNGTFIRVIGEMQLTTGALLLLGQQLFRIEF